MKKWIDDTHQKFTDEGRSKKDIDKIMLPLIENYIYLKYLKKLTVEDLRSYYESKWTNAVDN
jgi:hypothetical protein